MAAAAAANAPSSSDPFRLPGAEQEEAEPAPILPPLPSFFGSDGIQRSYTSQFESLQREQERLFGEMHLKAPERVAKLVVERDEALEAFTLAQSNLAENNAFVETNLMPDSAYDNGAGIGAGFALAPSYAPGPASSGVGADEMRMLLMEQRDAVEQQRRTYEESMRALVAELTNQQVSGAQLTAIERLSNSLEKALARVQALELKEEGGGRRAKGKDSRACVIS